ncbi:MAG TPA: hypothetical protein VKZ79_18670 [Alphaproteobacteria bacterium]|nr:hypothetical protein [Alphaproteobacteria bacterium]
MNSNSLAASLIDGYGRRASSDMLEALGLDRDDEELDAPRIPAKLTFEARSASIGRAANANLRLAV